MIKTHKTTKQRLLLKKDRGLVSTLFILDKNDCKILDTNKNGRHFYNANNEKVYKMAICLNTNLS